jgi:hypothetical protein
VVWLRRSVLSRLVGMGLVGRYSDAGHAESDAGGQPGTVRNKPRHTWSKASCKPGLE